MRKKLWLTYAWIDNEDRDIDFIVQELDKAGLDVRFDRRNLVPGRRLWSQIGGFITDPAECDAWGIILTSNSLASQACVEELSYALDRALEAKDGDFPIFGLMHRINAQSLPPALKIRLNIPLENNNWVQQTMSAVERRSPGLPITGLDEWLFKEHQTPDGYALEIRPRFDRVSPFAVAVDIQEKKSGNVTACYPGPADQVPQGATMFNSINSATTLTDGTTAWCWGADNEANSATSYYLFYKKKPQRIWFGHQQRLKLISWT